MIALKTRIDVLTLSLVSRSSEYPAGSLPELSAIIRNAGDNPVKLCTAMLEHRLLSSFALDYLQLLPFERTDPRPLTAADLRILAPGETLTVPLPLVKNSGWGFCYGASLPPIVDLAFAVQGAPCGTYTARVTLTNQFEFYQGESGRYDSKRIRYTVRTMPGADELDLSDLWDGVLDGDVRLDFLPPGAVAMGKAAYLRGLCDAADVIAFGRVRNVDVLGHDVMRLTRRFDLTTHDGGSVSYLQTCDLNTRVPRSGDRVLVFLKKVGETLQPMADADRDWLIFYAQNGDVQGPIGTLPISSYLDHLK